jgi:WhiB family transcriptional regulator, redox-sensing transcriptional regulator
MELYEHLQASTEEFFAYQDPDYETMIASEIDMMLSDEEATRAERARDDQREFILGIYGKGATPAIERLESDQLAGIMGELKQAYVQNGTFRKADAQVISTVNRVAELWSLRFEGYTDEEAARLGGVEPRDVLAARRAVTRSLHKTTPDLSRLLAAVGAPELLSDAPPKKQLAKGLGRTTLGAERPDGLCIQFDPETFFPENGATSRAAKRICQQCAVREECLTIALKNHEQFGIWGGLTDRERRKLLKRAV